MKERDILDITLNKKLFCTKLNKTNIFIICIGFDCCCSSYLDNSIHFTADNLARWLRLEILLYLGAEVTSKEISNLSCLLNTSLNLLYRFQRTDSVCLISRT